VENFHYKEIGFTVNRIILTTDQPQRARFLFFTFVCIYLSSGTFLTIYTGIQHDHIWYLREWIEESKGQNPWQVVNPYGPIQVLLGYGIRIHFLIPKLVMVWLFMLANFYFYTSQRGDLLTCRKRLYFLFLIPFNFLVVNIVMIYGLNDTLVASLVILAIDAKIKNRSKLAGFLLGIATLLKFYPLLFILFWAFDRRKFDFRLLYSSCVTISVGMILTFQIWGLKILYSLVFSLERSSSLLSPLEILKQFYLHNPDFQFQTEVFNHLLPINRFLIQYNFVFCLGATALVMFFSWKLYLHWYEISLLGTLSFLAVYKVGHPQFFLTWLILLLPLIFSNTYSSQKLLMKAIPLIVFLELYQIGFFLSKSYSTKWTFMYYNAGVVYLPIVLFTLLSFVNILRAEKGLKHTQNRSNL